MSILKAVCIGIAGTFLALQFQNSRKEYGIYLGIAVSIFLFLGMSQNLSVIRETLELVGSFVKIDAVYLTAMLKILGVTYLAEFAATIARMPVIRRSPDRSRSLQGSVYLQSECRY